jgi:hypothetical protein
MADESAQGAVEQITQEVKDVKLENGAAANGTPPKNEDGGAVSFKVCTFL